MVHFLRFEKCYLVQSIRISVYFVLRVTYPKLLRVTGHGSRITFHVLGRHFMRKFDAYKTFLFLEGAQAFLFGMIFTASAVYQVTVVGLTPLQLVLVGTLLEGICFLFEIPTGIVADVYSRRLSTIIGVILIGLGFFTEGWFPFFGAVLLAQIGWGLGATFTSGATQAWIADEIGEERTNQAFLRSSQVGSVASIFGILASAVLGSFYTVAVPVWLGGLLMVGLGIVLILIMPETGFKPTAREERNTWGQMTGTLRAGWSIVRTRPLLLTLIIIEVITGMFSEGYDRLNTVHLVNNFTFPVILGRTFAPVVWFATLGIVGSLLTTAVTELVSRHLDMKSDRAIARALTSFSAALIISLLVFALAPNFVIVVIGMLGVGLARSLIHPVRAAWTNQQIGSDDSHVRATVFSMFGQANAIGQIGGGPAVGWLGNWSLRAALAVSALLLLPALPLYQRSKTTVASTPV